MQPFSVEFTHELTGLRLTVTVDTRVAWATLAEADEIIADVWLFNVAAAPASVDLQSEPPFLNARELSRPFDQAWPAADDVTADWLVDGELLLADVYVRGVLVGRLSPGASPGWSAFATDAGPLAYPLT